MIVPAIWRCRPLRFSHDDPEPAVVLTWASDPVLSAQNAGPSAAAPPATRTATIRGTATSGPIRIRQPAPAIRAHRRPVTAVPGSAGRAHACEAGRGSPRV